MDVQLRTAAHEQLRRLLPPGSPIYIVLRAQTRRHHAIVGAFVVTDQRALLQISNLVAVALGRPYDQEREGMKIYEGENALTVVGQLSRALHGAPDKLAAEWI